MQRLTAPTKKPPPAVNSAYTNGVDGAPLRTLVRALQIMKTKARLAVALGMSVPELEGYLAGTMPLPNKVFITALDIVARGRGK